MLLAKFASIEGPLTPLYVKINGLRDQTKRSRGISKDVKQPKLR